MIGPTKLGGRITVILTLFWATCLFLYMMHGSGSVICEPVVGMMTLPLGLIDGVDYVFLRRGVIGLSEFITSLAMMIPNLFILGYGLAAILKVLSRYTASWTGDSGRGPSQALSTPQKIQAEQAAPSNR